MTRRAWRNFNDEVASACMAQLNDKVASACMTTAFVVFCFRNDIVMLARSSMSPGISQFPLDIHYSGEHSNNPVIY